MKIITYQNQIGLLNAICLEKRQIFYSLQFFKITIYSENWAEYEGLIRLNKLF